MRARSFLGALASYLRRHLALIAALVTAFAVFITVFWLYSLPMEAVVYAFLLSGAAFAVTGAMRFRSFLRRHRELNRLCDCVATELSALPEPQSVVEEDYQRLLRLLNDELSAAVSSADKTRGEMLDYYTLWAHQIKTPIAAMQLLLRSVEGRENTELLAELLKIEQYVEMVLGYLRLDSESTDYVLRRCSLDDIVRQCLRKYARLFILKKLPVDFRETGLTVLTDEKWLCFVIEQILSNSLKYTSRGGISLYAEGQSLVIEDTGIGIRAEDLPRVCERGFTGMNGREDKKSTGIGLYLCRRICDRLGHGLSVSSEVGVGTRVTLALDSVRLLVE